MQLCDQRDTGSGINVISGISVKRNKRDAGNGVSKYGVHGQRGRTYDKDVSDSGTTMTEVAEPINSNNDVTFPITPIAEYSGTKSFLV